ncbi:hypothetical protein EBR77_00600 [bacterium]|nr:hypothetical protein [bacterium]NBX78417.1 hypothetical protein [bacterium]
MHKNLFFSLSLISCISIYSADGKYTTDTVRTPLTLETYLAEITRAGFTGKKPEDIMNKHALRFAIAYPALTKSIQTACTISDNTVRNKQLYDVYKQAAHAGWPIEIDLYFATQIPKKVNSSFREYQARVNHEALLRIQKDGDKEN